MTQKVVINQRYGGFGLSPKAEVAYLKRKGKTAYFYDPDFTTKVWTKVVDLSQLTWIYHVLTVDLGDTVHDDDYDDADYFSSYYIPRDDPDLIAVVEEFGKESWSVHSELAIIEIPDDVDWEIDEYDGWKSIHEKHRTWS
jgi:hypothetical protein